jgi:hypothetical protein
MTDMQAHLVDFDAAHGLELLQVLDAKVADSDGVDLAGFL